jgi:hypothetical protein
MRSQSIVVLDVQVKQARFDLLGVWIAQAEARGLRLVAILWGDAAPALAPARLTDRAAILRFTDERPACDGSEAGLGCDCGKTHCYECGSTSRCDCGRFERGC